MNQYIILYTLYKTKKILALRRAQVKISNLKPQSIKVSHQHLFIEFILRLLHCIFTKFGRENSNN